MPTQKQKSDASLAPTTTAQQDMVVSGQRKINLIWEITQSLIALAITFAIIFAALNKIDAPVLTNSFFLIVGFYYSRTNHQAIGGMGSKANEDQEYKGR